MYATELAEIRKNNKTVSNAKLSMEQVQIRLNTVSELGDVVVTLSPCMSLIKGLNTSLGGMMPEVAESMQGPIKYVRRYCNRYNSYQRRNKGRIHNI
ncbi:MAG: hypothetical protein Ct9H300mP17_15040 [Candidatus Nitrosopelagicus sp.]|nr:MAG: hypothetical protein Ct9H300mP17_15040 [Candidatus Nitrosopelagicus sp.]